MQTFLPYPNMLQSLKVLDYKRLGKQRVEAKQILNALKYGGGWANHPAVRMWRGYELALVDYHNTALSVWQGRGYKNNMPYIPNTNRSPMPPWFGREDFHLSHQSNLLRKDFEYYSKFFPGVVSTLPYVWPVE